MNGAIILTLLYVVVVTPLGLLFRLGEGRSFARAGKALSRRILAGDEPAANIGFVRQMRLENSARWRPDRSLTIEMRAAFPTC